jgi:hypothetical protein
MKFFNIDCHISVIADVKNIFEKIGHQVETWSLSGHRWVFNLPKANSPIINENNWQSINEEMVEKFYYYHKTELDKYDAYICAYPPCFLKLFEKFNKPIIVISATRYDYPFLNDSKKLAWLEDSLINNKNIIKITNNDFDRNYCEKFLKNKWTTIPSLCDYTEQKHNPKNNKYILFSKILIKNLPDNIIHQSQMGKYTWKDLYSHSGIIHFPYNVSTMSIFEQDQANVPLLFPSLKMALELIKDGIPLFSEIVFPNRLENRQNDNFLNEKWLRYSDFYNGTIKSQEFESFEDLFNIINKNKIENIKKTINNKDIVYEKWKQILW